MEKIMTKITFGAILVKNSFIFKYYFHLAKRQFNGYICTLFTIIFSTFSSRVTLFNTDSYWTLNFEPLYSKNNNNWTFKLDFLESRQNSLQKVLFKGHYILVNDGLFQKQLEINRKYFLTERRIQITKNLKKRKCFSFCFHKINKYHLMIIILFIIFASIIELIKLLSIPVIKPSANASHSLIKFTIFFPSDPRNISCRVLQFFSGVGSK